MALVAKEMVSKQNISEKKRKCQDKQMVKSIDKAKIVNPVLETSVHSFYFSYFAKYLYELSFLRNFMKETC